MKLISPDKLEEGKYYLCYEIFSDGEHSVAYGKAFLSLYGEDFSVSLSFTYSPYDNGITKDTDSEWWLYDDGMNQLVFEMNQQEIFNHVLLENI